MPSGSGFYIASAANDSTIRVFTRTEEMMASSQERAEWDKEVGGRQLDKSQVGDVKHSDLPGMEALGREGKKDGQVLMIKNNGVVEAYQWSGPSSTWQQIGQVVDAIGSGRKQLFEGQEYDYVFDVDVSEGMPPLKLPYNVTENPWLAAQKFLNKNDLPESYVEQVVEFIEKNTEGVKLGQGGEGSTYVDPYTGASRYTGATNSKGPTSGGVDPFTGSSAYSTAPAVASKSNGVLPVKTYLSFKQFNVNAAKGKIAQLNEEVKTSSPELAITLEDEKNLSEVYAFLSQPGIALPDPNKHDANERYDPSTLLDLALRWPEAQRFPLLDLLRALATVSPSLGTITSVTEALLKACDWGAPWEASKARETNTLLALRALANLFLTANGRRTISGSNAGDLLRDLRKGRTWSEVGTRKLPLVTIALNFSVMAVDKRFPVIHTNALLDLVIFVLENESTDSETIYRASIALGNLLISPSTSGSLQVGLVQHGKELVKERATALGEKRLMDLASEISSIGA
ncbi:MAG: hypothetical protein TREMPRED_005963 [Tremellales sp. Tagirdzhanova-0007]|nr:MAG: hypothetical protein TREMPRED_005963 [Tremellales sp. Tagirdzhanova-0007]